MSLLGYFLSWLAGFVVIQIGVTLSLRSEPTAHGQMVGRQLGCVVGLFWPLVLPYLVVVGLVYGLVWLARAIRARFDRWLDSAIARRWFGGDRP